MASAARQSEPYITLEEHEKIEQQTGEKHEWYDGEVFAMASASPVHNTISANILRDLGNQLLDGDCQPWGSEQPVYISAQRALMYPDIVLACPPFEYDDVRRNTLLNPRAVVEVLSPSTGSYDQGRRFDLYASIPSLRHYILVSTDERYIEHFERTSAGWLQHAAPRDGECITLADIERSLCLDEVYEAIEVTPAEDLPNLNDEDAIAG